MPDHECSMMENLIPLSELTKEEFFDFVNHEAELILMREEMREQGYALESEKCQ